MHTVRLKVGWSDGEPSLPQCHRLWISWETDDDLLIMSGISPHLLAFWKE